MPMWRNRAIWIQKIDLGEEWEGFCCCCCGFWGILGLDDLGPTLNRIHTSTEKLYTNTVSLFTLKLTSVSLSLPEEKTCGLSL